MATRDSDWSLVAMLDSKQLRMSEDSRIQAEDHYYAALDHFAEGKYESAIEEYRQALAVDPNFTDAMHGLARVLQDLERYDEAIEVARKLAEINSEDILAHTSLSILYQKKGMIPEAEAEANKARVLGWKKQLLDQKAQQKQ
jgi:tetratricopeptide (TPR) repeat protein